MAAKILLIEDQHAAMIADLLHLYTPSPDGESQLEFEIITDGCTAVERLALLDLPDLILLDLRLPGVGGLVVLDAIRKMDSRLPVIVVSAFGDKRTRQEAKQRGANDFFQKPISAVRLYRRIKELLVSTRVFPYRQASGTDTIILEGQQAQMIARIRRLQKLKEREALLGLAAPPELLIEIEDIEREIGQYPQN